jgi:hypothetical protein
LVSIDASAYGSRTSPPAGGFDQPVQAFGNRHRDPALTRSSSAQIERYRVAELTMVRPCDQRADQGVVGVIGSGDLAPRRVIGG